MAKRARERTTSPSSFPGAHPASDFHADQWTTLNGAFARIHKAVGSRDFAERDLQRDLHSGRLPAAARWLNRHTGEERFERLQPSFWESARATAFQRSETEIHVRVQAVLLGRIDPDSFLARVKAGWVGTIYIQRRDLDKLYPAPIAAAVSSEPDSSAESSTMRRPPGRKPTRNWKTLVTRELLRLARDDDVTPTPAQMCAWCEKMYGYHPDLRDMQRLYRDLAVD
jgi:hypothetical protein